MAMVMRGIHSLPRASSTKVETDEVHPDSFATEGEMLRYLISKIDGMKGEQHEMKVAQTELVQGQKRMAGALWKKASTSMRDVVEQSRRSDPDSPMNSPRSASGGGLQGGLVVEARIASHKH